MLDAVLLCIGCLDVSQAAGHRMTCQSTAIPDGLGAEGEALPLLSMHVLIPARVQCQQIEDGEAVLALLHLCEGLGCCCSGCQKSGDEGGYVEPEGEATPGTASRAA